MKYFNYLFFLLLLSNTSKASEFGKLIGMPKDTVQKREIQEVQILGETVKKNIENSGFAAQVIEVKKISNTNVQLNELLDRTTGIKVRQSGGLGSEAVYNLNGMSGRSVGIFIDGIEISTFGSSFNLQSIPSSQIDRIEVYKGVLPIHLSGEYLGGAINIILKSDFHRNSVQASASYGSFNTFQGQVSAQYRNPNSGWFLNVSGFHTYTDNDYEVWGKFVRNEMPDGRMVHVKAKRFNDAFRSSGGNLETGFSHVSWADKFMISYRHTDSYKEAQHGQFMSKPYMGRFSNANAHILGLNYNKKGFLIENLDFDFQAIGSFRTQNIQDTVPWAYNWYGEKIIGLKGDPIRTRDGAQQGRPTLNKIERNILNTRGGLSYALPFGSTVSLNHSFYIVDRQDADPLRSVLEQKYQAKSNLFRNVYGGNIQHIFGDNKWQINAFIKLYQQNIERTEPMVDSSTHVPQVYWDVLEDQRFAWGYGGTVSYKVLNNLNLLGSAEKAVRMPGEGEIFGQQAENLVANLTIKPEISNNYNLGFRWNKSINPQAQLHFYASGFIRDTQDKISVFANDRSVSNVETLYYVNLDRTQSIGFETEAQLNLKNWDFMLSFSKFNSLFLNPNIPQRHKIQVPNEPFVNANAQATYKFSKLRERGQDLQLHYYFLFVDSFNTIWDMADNSTWVPTQFSHDFGITYSFLQGKYSVSFDAKNIFNQEVYDNYAAQKPGRAFYLKLNYSLHSNN